MTNNTKQVVSWKQSIRVLVDVKGVKILQVARQWSCIKRVLFLAVAVVVINYLCHPRRFPGPYHYIEKEDIPSYITYGLPNQKKPCTFEGGKVHIGTVLKNIRNTNVSAGDQLMKKTWEQQKCSPFSVAIIVPYRNRKEHLDTFLQYMHWFLQTQLVDYHIYVVEQSEKREFNRALLFNIGYHEAMRRKGFPCFIFHDIDLLPENLDNLYACTRCPRHMSAAVNTMRYTLLYRSLFGGVVAFLSDHFTLVNGFPNRYFGWGGEDDDMSLRVTNKNLQICRFPPLISRYTMLPHKPSKPNDERLELLERGREDQHRDGLNNVLEQYRNIKSENSLRFTLLRVELLWG